MKAVIQRVENAAVTVDGRVVGSIGGGYMILLGVVDTDTEAEARLLAAKTASLRVFRDENDKMNLSILQVGGEALVISQFTLCADTRKGNRPSFTSSAEPKRANELYELYMDELRKNGVKKVEKGEFGAHMKVSLVNDGPATIILDTDTWKRA